MSIYTLIPLLPLAASVVLALNARRLEGSGHRIVVPAVAGSFLLSVVAFVEVARNGAMRIPLYRLLASGDLVIDLGLFIDQLTVLLLLLVTGVSAVVQVYASRYMIGDSRHSRFFALTALFTSAMLVLVMSSNLLLTYIFWEIMGLCSYLLISHYAQRRSAYRAATKVFLVNSVADVGLGFGVILTFRTFGTLDIPEIMSSVDRVADQTVQLGAWVGLDWQVHVVTLITLFLFMGAMGKSAQMPFHVWLPFAMEAPTPVSALIHAATMVNAGPFLLVRLSPLVALSPTAMGVIATVGAVTALFAALVSLTQTDIKRTLAYSTVSQLGFMTLLCGVGAFVAAIFHLLAHGFFKAFLFLSTGNVLASTHRPREARARDASGPMKPLFAGALLMSSIPPLVIFSGPYQHLWVAQDFTAARVLFWIVGLGTVFFTALYMFRGVTSLFSEGPPAAPGSGTSSEVGPRVFSMRHVISVAITTALSVFVLVSAWTWLNRFLSPAVGRSLEATGGSSSADDFSIWILVPLAVALLGWSVAYARFRSSRASILERSSSLRWSRALYVFFLNKGYFDEIYDVYVVGPTLGFARWLWRTVDTAGVDRLVMSLGTLTVSFSRWLWRTVDTAGVDRLVMSLGTLTVSFSRWLWSALDMGSIARTADGFAGSVEASGQSLRKLEPRTLQQNLLVMVFLLVIALGFFYWIE